MNYVMFELHLVHCEFHVFNSNFLGMMLMELVHVHVHTYHVMIILTSLSQFFCIRSWNLLMN